MKNEYYLIELILSNRIKESEVGEVKLDFKNLYFSQIDTGKEINLNNRDFYFEEKYMSNSELYKIKLYIESNDTTKNPIKNIQYLLDEDYLLEDCDVVLSINNAKVEYSFEEVGIVKYTVNKSSKKGFIYPTKISLEFDYKNNPNKDIDIFAIVNNKNLLRQVKTDAIIYYNNTSFKGIYLTDDNGLVINNVDEILNISNYNLKDISDKTSIDIYLTAYRDVLKDVSLNLKIKDVSNSVLDSFDITIDNTNVFYLGEVEIKKNNLELFLNQEELKNTDIQGLLNKYI